LDLLDYQLDNQEPVEDEKDEIEAMERRKKMAADIVLKTSSLELEVLEDGCATREYRGSALL
jgi:hypothetical protein